MSHNRFRSLCFFCVALGLMVVSSMPAYGQRVWTLVAQDFKALPLQFPTADTGYAMYEDSLIRTTDGGQSWNPVNLPIERSRVWTTTTFCGSMGWLSAMEVDSIPYLGKLLQTTDYGFSWSIIPMDSSWEPEGIYFKSPSLGYLWGYPDGAGDSAFFDISTDSGRTWQPRTVPPTEDGSGILAAAFGQPNVILAEISNCEMCGNFPYLSTDTGYTWSRNDSIYDLMATGGFNGIGMAYIGSNTWISYNAWTTDNGKTWDTVPTTAPPSYAGTIFSDTLGHGMFNGYDTTKKHQYDSILYFTTDFGHSWDSTKVPFKSATYVPIRGSGWYAAAGDGNLYRSQETPLSVSRTSEPAQFQILTNPATHFLQISMEDIPDDIRIVDFLGRTVARYSTQGGEFTADVSGLPEGVYWVVTRSGALPFIHLAP